MATMAWAVAVGLTMICSLPVAARAQETAAPSAAPTADMAANDDAPDAPPPPATETPAPLLTPVPAASVVPMIAPSPAPLQSASPASVGPASASPASTSPAVADAEPPATAAPSVASIIPNGTNAPLASPAVAAGSLSAAASSSPVAVGSTPAAGSPNGNDGKVINPTSGLSALFGGGSPANGSASGASGVSGKAAEPPSATSLAFSFLALLGFCVLGLVLMRRRLGFSVPGIKGQRKLVVSETRALGNRQFLLVVEYENQRVLLGVTPGKIDYLCELTPPVSAGPSEAGAASAVKEDYGALIDQAKARQTP